MKLSLFLKTAILIIIFTLFSANVFAELPARGSLMATVEAEFGSPNEIAGAVGQPPITRWHYNNFTVIFEYEHVVHAFPRSSAVESLRTQNTDGLILPDQAKNTDNTEYNSNSDPSSKPSPESDSQPFSDDPPKTDNSFFSNTPDLIK